MNTQQLWLPARDLHKNKPINIPVGTGRSLVESQSLVEELLTVDGFKGETVSFA